MPAFCLCQVIVFASEVLKTHVKYYLYLTDLLLARNILLFSAFQTPDWGM